MSTEMEKGLIILIIGMGIVFMGLVLLHQVFQHIVPFALSIGKKKVQVPEINTGDQPAKQYSRTGEEITAIAAAVHLFMEEAHDEENAILTISSSSKNYSPWSSKIYATHHLGRK